MYEGYLSIGGEFIDDQRFELINTGRVQAYVENWNQQIRQRTISQSFRGDNAQCIDWLEACDDCESADAVFTDGRGYLLPQADPAPWFDPAVRDSEKFFGVMGLGVAGADDSTRTASVQTAIGGGGVVSRLRFGPRTLVVRGLAVAADTCGMEVGLNWLRCQYETQIDPCGGDVLWFLDCCPSCETSPNSPVVGPCWPDTYGELKSPLTIDCDGAWTPDTYGELRSGPPDFTTSGWCAWVLNYRELSRGLPEFSCDLQQCLVPYLRNFQRVRVIEGPTVLSRKKLSTGEVAEIEFTIVCGDPHEYAPVVVVAPLQDVPAPAPAPYADPPPPAPPAPNPFFEAVEIQPRPVFNPRTLPLPPQWERSTIPFSPVRRTTLAQIVPSVLLAAETRSGPVRVGLWNADNELVGGFTVPFVPAEGVVKVDSILHEVLTEFQGEARVFNGFALDYEGGRTAKFADLPAGSYMITVDQTAGEAVPLQIEVLAAEKGCA